MQTSLEHASPTWVQVGISVVSLILGGGVYKLCSLWVSRAELQARARKVDAETRQLDVKTQQMRGDIVMEFVDRLSNQQLRIDQVTRERDEWKEKAEIVQAQNRILELQLQDSMGSKKA